MVHFFQGLLRGVKAVLTTPRALVVHHIKFFIEERVKRKLPLENPFFHLFNSIIVHIIHYLFLLGDFKVLSHLIEVVYV